MRFWAAIALFVLCASPEARAEGPDASLIPGKLPSAASAAVPAPAHHWGSGGSVVVIPPGFPKDVSLDNKPCTYTPAIINSASGALPSPPITACNDARLSAGQQAACLKCIGIKRRDACLKTTAATYWHADDQSCAWVGQRPRDRHSWAAASKTTEIRYSLGINALYDTRLSLADNTCRVDVKVEIVNPFTQQVFPVAWMPMSMSGKLADGKDVPKGLIPWLACTLTKGTKVCQGSIDRPAFIKTEPYLGIYQEIYTNRLAAVLEWQKTNATCLNAPAETGTCAALPEPYKFDYVLRVTEHPCKPRIPQSNKAAKTLKVPYAEVGTLMYAGGKQFDVTRATYYYLEGARSVQWSMRVPRQKGPMSPMFVAVINVTTFYNAACTWAPDGVTLSCDMSAAASQALPGTPCTGYVCRGSYTFSGPATAQHGLMVAYPRFTYNTNMPWILNATETPTQIVDIFEVVTA